MIPRRLERIESVLRQEIADLLLMKVKDPRVKNVHVVSVRVSPDLSTAKVLYSTLMADDDIEQIQKGLDSAKAFFRREVCKHVQLRKPPEIFFVYDPSIREGDRMLTLLKKLDIPPAPPEDDSGPADDGDGPTAGQDGDDSPPDQDEK